MVAIPVLNEEKTIAKVIDRIPKRIKGIKEIQIVIVDDGSTDKSAQIALRKGAEVISHPYHLGLGAFFATAQKKFLQMGLVSV